jgi:hypothetical protein
LDVTNPKWQPLHPPATFNIQARRKKKLLEKNTWFKQTSRQEDQDQAEENSSILEEEENKHRERGQPHPPSQQEEGRNVLASSRQESGRPEGRKSFQKMKKKPDPPTLTVLFVDQTPGGVLAKRLQRVEDNLAKITGYRVRVTETAGTQLCRVLPNTNPWSGMDCMREDCYPCSQGGEKLQNCKKRNILYESICQLCNPEEENKRKDGKLSGKDGIYVGESGRSLYERAGEHIKDARGMEEKSHIVKHWATSHPELKSPPKFKMKIVSSFQDAMTRQISESVRIDMRGGGGGCSIRKLSILDADSPGWL